MAASFLDRIGSALNSFGSQASPFLDVLGPAAKLYGEVRGQKQANQAINQSNVPTQAEAQQNALYQALLDPNSPLLRRLVEQDRATNVADLQTGIRERQLADRRAQALGRSPTFFNPERADEAVSFLTSRGLPQANALAQETAQNKIIRAATGYSGMQRGQQDRLNTSMQQGVGNAAYQSGIPQRIIDILNGKGGQSGQPVTAGYVNRPAQEVFGNINWG